MSTGTAHGLGARHGLHRVVVRDLGMRIVRGQLGEGAALPPEADLSTELGVSPGPCPGAWRGRRRRGRMAR